MTVPWPQDDQHHPVHADLSGDGQEGLTAAADRRLMPGGVTGPVALGLGEGAFGQELADGPAHRIEPEELVRGTVGGLNKPVGSVDQGRVDDRVEDQSAIDGQVHFGPAICHSWRTLPRIGEGSNKRMVFAHMCSAVASMRKAQTAATRGTSRRARWPTR